MQSLSGPVGVEVLDAARVRASMGVPRFAAAAIPLNLPDADRYHLPVGAREVEFGAVSMGNPHAVIEVDDVASAPLATLGAALSADRHFPQGCNVGFVQILERRRVRLRVWERGAGLTKACGTGACAALVAAHRRGLVDRKATLEMDGGELVIEWRESDNHVIMTGPVEVEFAGRL